MTEFGCLFSCLNYLNYVSTPALGNCSRLTPLLRSTLGESVQRNEQLDNFSSPRLNHSEGSAHARHPRHPQAVQSTHPQALPARTSSVHRSFDEIEPRPCLRPESGEPCRHPSARSPQSDRLVTPRRLHPRLGSRTPFPAHARAITQSGCSCDYPSIPSPNRLRPSSFRTRSFPTPLDSLFALEIPSISLSSKGIMVEILSESTMQWLGS